MPYRPRRIPIEKGASFFIILDRRHRRVTVQTETSSIFAILEFPPSASAGVSGTDPASGPQFDFSLAFKQYKPSALPAAPVPLKAMLTDKVVVQDFTCYVPQLPCVTDFAEVPAFELPLGGR